MGIKWTYFFFKLALLLLILGEHLILQQALLL